jgi:dipeptidyl aminopeptidase/acylaminoacyl peptidase
VGKTEEKLKLYKDVVDSFERGKALSIYDKPIKVEIPYLHNTMPGWLIIPDGASDDVPVAIVIPGATGYKEENYTAALKLWERGVAVLIFDGPGQGEALLFRDYYYDLTNYEKAVEAVMNFVRADSRVGNTIGLYGISYGGYLAPRTACFHSDELACVVGRGGSDNSFCLILDEIHEKAFLGKFKAKLNITDDSEAKAVINEMNIIEETKNIKCPLLMVHTEADFVVTVEGARRLVENASSKDKELKLIPGRQHCADDNDEMAGSYVADWMIERMIN